MELNRDTELKHLNAQMQMAQIQNYYSWSISHIGNKLGKRIWDSSAGIGTYAEEFRKKTDFLLLTEFSEENLKRLQDKYKNATDVAIQYCDLNHKVDLDFEKYQLDTVISLDVIEHLKNDLAALRSFYDALQPGGHVLIKTPAHQSLFCDIDKSSLHYRRYSTRILREKLRKVGFNVLFCRYMNAPGALAYLVKGKLLKRDTNFSNTFSHRGLSIIKRVIPLIKGVEAVVPPPFGLSVIALAQK